MNRLSNPEASGPVVLPTVIEQTSCEDSHTLSLEIPPSLAFFNGHFDQNPVVPGYVLSGWALHYTRYLWPKVASTRYSCPVLKFTSPVRPKDRLSLKLSFAIPDRRVKFVYIFEEEGTLCCSGQIRFQDTASPSHPG